MTPHRRGDGTADGGRVRPHTNELEQYDRPEDRIRHHRQASKGPVLIVEGVEDELVMQEHFPDVAIFPVSGKPIALRVAAALTAWAIDSWICLVDYDFDGLPTPWQESDFVRVYPQRDMEAWLIALGALAKLLNHSASQAKRAAAGDLAAWVQEFIDVVQPVTNLRMANARHASGLTFDAVDIADKIVTGTGELKRASYCDALRSASPDASLSKSAIERMSEEVCEDGRGPRGKDVLAVAGVSLRKRLATMPQQAVSLDVMCSNLRNGAALLITHDTWFTELAGDLRNR